MDKSLRSILVILLLPWISLDPSTAANRQSFQDLSSFPRSGEAFSLFDTQAITAGVIWSERSFSEGAASWSRRITQHPAEFEAISGQPFRLEPGKPAVAVFDLHGTLLLPTWRQEYIRAYRHLTGAPLQDAESWVSKSTIRVPEEELFKTLAETLGKSYEEVAEAFRTAQDYVRANDEPELVPGALEFLRALKERGVPIYVISGSPRARVLDQMRVRGLLEFVPEGHVVGRDDVERSAGAGAFRDRAIEGIPMDCPGHQILYFNDWVGSFDLIHELGGKVFGLPQGAGDAHTLNRQMLIDKGADFILNDFRHAHALIDALGISNEAQQNVPSLAIAEHEAQEVPYVYAFEFPNGDSLFFKLSADLSRLTYSLLQAAGDIEFLAEFPSNYLFSPLRYIFQHVPEPMKTRILDLWHQNRRVTRYGGIEVTWDKRIDKGVWTTNIDSAYLHRSIEEAGLLKKIPIRRATEVGVGGGHGSAFLANRIQTLEELAVTDINPYALKAAKRNLMRYLKPNAKLKSYLGKGLKTIEGMQDVILINPPYIPSPPFDPRPATDSYRGTGLIREVFQIGLSKLNPYNPEASILMNISSLAQKDFETYQEQFGQDWVIEPVGPPLRVPLKVESLDQRWIDWLVENHGLEFNPHAKKDEEPYYHTLQTYRMRRRATAREILQTEIQTYNDLIVHMRREEIGPWQWADGRIPNPRGGRLGFFGITADPIHPAHVSVVVDEIKTHKLDAVVIVLALDHLYKQGSGASLAERMAMIRRAYGNQPNIYFAFSKSGRYLDFAETSQSLFPKAVPYIMMGTENVYAMARYNTRADLERLEKTGAHLLVHQRYDEVQDVQTWLSQNQELWPSSLVGRIHFVSFDSNSPYSSSLIRALIADGDILWRRLVPEPVAQIIEALRLYPKTPTAAERRKIFLDMGVWLNQWIREGKLHFIEKWLPYQTARNVRDNTLKPNEYPERFPVDHQHLDPSVPWPDYAPAYVRTDVVRQNDETKNPLGWAHPEDISKVSREEMLQADPNTRFDERGYPINRQGRTGLWGQGSLGRHGANVAGDAVLTYENKRTGQLFMLIGIRKKGGSRAVPGGFFDKFQDSEAGGTATRELLEETNIHKNMREGELIFDEIADDSRNTDTSYIISKAFWIHLSEEEAMAMRPKPGDDLVWVGWVPVDEKMADSLFASHGTLARIVLNRWRRGDLPVSRTPGVERLFKQEALAPRAVDSIAAYDEHIRSATIQMAEALQHSETARVNTATDSRDPNEPDPELGSIVKDKLAALESPSMLAKVRGNRVLEALHAQTIAHLRNVSFSLRTEIGNDDYPHEYVLKGPYPRRPTLMAIKKADEFMSILLAEKGEIASLPANPEREKELKDEQTRFIKKMTDAPLKSYRDMRKRLQRDGVNASFQEELGANVEYLELKLMSDPDVLRLCREDAHLAGYRLIVLGRLQALPPDRPYLDTFYAIERAVEFFDIVRRAQSPEPLPDIYHSAHYEYYLHSLMGEIPNHIALPTLADLTGTDFLKLRGVPIGVMGVKTDTLRVDGFPQTPYELFVHDANHARRMYQLAKERALELGMSEQEFYAFSDHFVQTVLVPLFVVVPGDSYETVIRKQATKNVLFEFTHEQSFAADPDVLIAQILRPPSQRTPFERIENDTEVVYYTEHRATCLAYAYRKLAHNYHDDPANRDAEIAVPEARTRPAIVEATAALLIALGMKDPPMETLREYVSSDDLPNASYRKTVQDDITARPNETIPLNSEEDPSLQPLLLMKSQFQKTIQQVSPWDESSLRFLSRRLIQHELVKNDPLRAPKVGYFKASIGPFRATDAQKIRDAIKTQNLDEVVIVLSRKKKDGPSVEDLALEAMMIQAVFKDEIKVSIAVTGSAKDHDIRRNVGRHFAELEMRPIDSAEVNASNPSPDRLRLFISDGEMRKWKPLIAPESAALIERWALFRKRIAARERRYIEQAEQEKIAGEDSKQEEALTPLRAMRSVYSYPFPEILELLGKFFTSSPTEILKGWLTPEGLDHYQDPIIERLLEFQKEAVPALNEFPEQYPTAGANEGLRATMTALLVKGVKQIYVLQGEYEGYREIAEARGMSVIEVREDTDPKTLPPGYWYISNPSARDGNILPDHFIQAICDAGHYVYYDLAYMGLTDFHRFDVSHPHILAVFVSLSKSFGIFSYRVGFTFSRKEIPDLEGNVWFKNIFSLQVAETILKGIKDPQYLVRRYRPLQQKVVARLNRDFGLDLIPSDVILLAHRRGDEGLSDEKKGMLQRFMRGPFRRLTLSLYFQDEESRPGLHIKARQRHLKGPIPVPVPDDKVDWDVPDPGYHPIYTPTPEVLANDRTKVKGGWADPQNFDSIKEDVWKRVSFVGPLKKDPVTGKWRNPMGKTGKEGGPLGANGPNFAVDPVMTFINPATGRRQVVLVQRKDNGEWSIPGSMVNSSQELLEFMRRGFAKKALGATDENLGEFKGLLDALFASGDPIYKGYMDDDKNADDRWMESFSVLFDLSNAVARKLILALRPGADTLAVKCVDVDDVLSGKIPLYANHTDLVRRAVETLNRERPFPKGRAQTQADRSA